MDGTESMNHHQILALRALVEEYGYAAQDLRTFTKHHPGVLSKLAGTWEAIKAFVMPYELTQERMTAREEELEQALRVFVEWDNRQTDCDGDSYRRETNEARAILARGHGVMRAQEAALFEAG